MRSLRRTLAPSLMLALVAITGSILPATAAVVVKQGGAIGSYSYTDTAGATGARCEYGLAVPGANGNDLDRIMVDHPIVFSKAGQRTVGWRFIVQRSLNVGGTGGWRTIHASTFQKRSATTSSPASFTDRSFLIPTDKDFHFRTLVVIRWYEAGSSTDVAGSVRLRTEYYRSLNGGSRVDMDRCLPEY